MHSPKASPVVLPRHSAEYLARCVSFSTLEEHARAIAEELGLDDEGGREILPELRRCAAAGLLLPLSSVLDTAPSSPEPASAIASAGCVSANRVASARRALESYKDNARRFGRDPEWVLYDDSADAAVRAEYRSMLGALEAERGGAVLYAGYEEKLAYARDLAGEGIPMETVEFCLFGVPGIGARYGANLNGRLLDTAGQACVSIDDDTLCDMGARSEAPSPVRLVSGDPTEFHYYGAIAEARASLERREEDFLALHESLLGRSLRACVAGTELRPPTLDRAGDRLICSLASGVGRIAATQMGIAGDSGMGSSFYYLLAEGGSRERLVRDKASYRAFMESRAVVRMVGGAALCDSPPFMNYAVGLDNRLLLPPFLPVLRNCDGLFGNMLPILIPEAFFGYLPRAVGHEPPERRRSNAAMIAAAAAGTGAADTIGRIIRSFPSNCVGKSSVPDRTRALGRFLAGVGGLLPRELEELLSPLYLREKAKLLAYLDRLLVEHGGESAEWAGDIRACIDAVHAAIPLRESALPADIRGPDFDTRIQAFRDIVLRYGGLLIAWPDMVEAAKKLRANGRRPARHG